MLNVLNRHKIELAGLDIGSSAVKLVRLNKGIHGYTLVTAVAEPIADGGDDKQQQRQNCVNAVRNCLQKSGLRQKNVVCGVSGREVVVRGFTFPSLPDAAVQQAVRMEAQQVCPLDIHQSVLDFQLINTPVTEPKAKGEKARTRAGVMTVGTQRVIDEQTALLTDAGGKALMVDVNVLALLNCLNQLELIEPRETVAVIDVGNALTNVVIYGQDGLPFVRDISQAGEKIVQQMSRDLDISEQDVRQLLIREQVSDQLDDKLLLSLNNAIAPLANAVNETLRFYSFQEKQSGVNRIFLCGGFALIDAFVEFFTDALPVPVGLLNPFTNIESQKSADETEALVKNGPVYAAAVGLAMRTVE